MGEVSIQAGVPANVFRTGGRIRLVDRQRLFGHAAVTIWLTGLSGAGKSTIAYELEARLVRGGFSAVVLDGDNLRHGINRNLGFTDADRRENLRRVAEVARLMNDAGLIVICSCISPLRIDREMARDIVANAISPRFTSARRWRCASSAIARVCTRRRARDRSPISPACPRRTKRPSRPRWRWTPAR